MGHTLNSDSFAVGRAPAGVVHFSFRESVAATDRPLTLEDVKCYLVLEADDSSDDALLESLIDAATEYVEVNTGVSLVNRTYEYKLDRFPSDNLIELLRPPLVSVTSIQYVDTDDATQTLATTEYQVDTDSIPGRITEAPDKNWPSTSSQTLNAVTVTYVAGYGSEGEDVPANLRTAMLLLVNDYYNNREAQTIGTIVTDNPVVERLLMASRQPRFY